MAGEKVWNQWYCVVADVSRVLGCLWGVWTLGVMDGGAFEGGGETLQGCPGPWDLPPIAAGGSQSLLPLRCPWVLFLQRPKVGVVWLGAAPGLVEGVPACIRALVPGSLGLLARGGATWAMWAVWGCGLSLCPFEMEDLEKRCSAPYGVAAFRLVTDVRPDERDDGNDCASRQPYSIQLTAPRPNEAMRTYNVVGTLCR